MLVLCFVVISAALTALVTVELGLCAAPAQFYRPLLIFIAFFLACNVAYVLMMGIVSLFMSKKEPIKKQNRFSRAICAGVAEMLSIYARLKVKVSGEELIPTDTRFVFICNHRSLFDPLCVMDKLRRHNISFISKPSNIKLPIVGRIAWNAGFLPINRENDREALKTILTAADYIKRDLCSIGIYPEGTRSKTMEMLPFHAGSFKAAQRANVPVVVACVSGTEKIKKNIPLRSTRARLDILAVIPAEEVKAKSTVELADISKSLIKAHLDEIEGENR